MSTSLRSFSAARCFALLASAFFLVWSCAPAQHLPQPHAVVNPSTMANAVRAPRYDLAAAGYAYNGEGFDYIAAGVLPICLALSNKSDSQPQILIEEVRGLSRGGEYLPYSVAEAVRLVVASNAFETGAKNAAVSGGVGAAVGAGLGVLVGLLAGGNDLVWKGALLGGAIGGATGAMSSGPRSQHELRFAVEDELHRYAWNPAPLPPHYSQTGYVYFPSTVGIYSVKVVVRMDKDVATHIVPLSLPPAR
jgi:hypothetical protein